MKIHFYLKNEAKHYFCLVLNKTKNPSEIYAGTKDLNQFTKIIIFFSCTFG